MLNAPTRFEDEFPEEAETLMQICHDRGEDRKAGVKNKPLYLDAPTPIVMEYKLHNYHQDRPTYSAVTTVKRSDPKVGRNDPCPCGSGKKFKKCCIM